MTVADLIKILEDYPQDLTVVYCLYSERCMLEEFDIQTVQACIPRPDGWVENKRPDKPCQTYLQLPGN